MVSRISIRSVDAGRNREIRVKHDFIPGNQSILEKHLAANVPNRGVDQDRVKCIGIADNNEQVPVGIQFEAGIQLAVSRINGE